MFRNDDEPEPRAIPEISFPAEIEYRVYGIDQAVNITIDDSLSERITVFGELPWSYSFTADSLRPLYVTTQVQGEVPITLELWIGGELTETQTFSGHENARGIVRWVNDEHPRISYHHTAPGPSSVSLRTMNGPMSYSAEDMSTLGASTLLIGATFDVEHGFDAWIQPTFTPVEGRECPQYGIGYRSDEGYSYTLALARTCESGYTLRATVPDF